MMATAPSGSRTSSAIRLSNCSICSCACSMCSDLGSPIRSVAFCGLVSNWSAPNSADWCEALKEANCIDSDRGSINSESECVTSFVIANCPSNRGSIRLTRTSSGGWVANISEATPLPKNM